MKRLPVVMTITLVGALAVVWVSAQGQSGAALTGQDYAEIQQLLARYYQAIRPTEGASGRLLLPVFVRACGVSYEILSCSRIMAANG